MNQNPHKFVVAFNRDRDSYQVALALAEAGMLETLVTDFYASPLRAKLLPRLKHRCAPGLDAKLTESSLFALLVQALGPKVFSDLHTMLAVTHRVLGKRARSVARRSDADLLLYSEHALEAFADRRLRKRKRILFTFHPHRRLICEVLAEDAERFSDISWGLHEEAPAPELEAREDGELEMAQLVLCASTFTKESLLHAGVPSEKIKVVPYGSDVRTNAAGDRNSLECRFLFVGQGVQRKGLHHLLRVWNKLALPNASLTLVCYRIDPAITKLAGANVRIVSALPQNELAAVYASSHVFVMPSLIEGFGLVFLEAMAAGCHVIGTKNTGLPDLDMAPELMSVIDAGELEELAHAMESAYESHQAGALMHEEIVKAAEARSWAVFRERLRGVVNAFVEQER
jgi:glycosyltransferase involved in cell wall biosynthesis